MAEPDDRAHAARLLHQVIGRGHTIDQAFAAASDPIPPVCREMVYGSLRHFFSLGAQIDTVLHQPTRQKDQDIYALMIVGAYQLRHMRIPAHAAINETVNACRALDKPWAKGLVNAVLRKIGTTDQAPADPERTFEHPRWMIELLDADFPDQAVGIMEANNQRAPMALRINVLRAPGDSYCRTLDDAGIVAAPGWLPETLVLESAMPTDELPGFRAGQVSVQDAGAQFVPGLIPVQSQARFLDACAAPGGKLCHFLERYPDIVATALDHSASRLEQLRQQAARLGHGRFTSLLGDARDLTWWDGNPFDLVLVDAPCSGSGTIRRHPDIKVLRHRKDIGRYADVQLELVENLWRTVRPGGTLLYCTCSLFAEENDRVVDSFLHARQPPAGRGDMPARNEGPPSTGVAEVLEISLPTGQATRFGWQLLPTNQDPDKYTDGFYFASLKKR